MMRPEPLLPANARSWRFWHTAVLGSYLVGFTVLRLLLSKYIEYDDAEQLLFAQSLGFGYSAQPPLYTWMLWIVVQVFGANVLSVTLLKTGLLAAFYVLLHQVARRFLSSEPLAALASLSPLLMPLFVWEVPRLTHTLLLCNACLATMLCVLRLHEGRRTTDFALLGVAIGMGLLSKYNFILFASAMFAGAMTSRPFRTDLWERRLALACLIAVTLCLPHAYWLVGHFHEAYSRFDQRNGENGGFPLSGLLGLGSFFLNLAIGTATLWTTYFLLYRRSRPIDAAAKPSAAFQWMRQSLIAMVAVWAILVVGTGMRELRLPWLAPLLAIVPIWFFAGIGRADLEVRRRIHAGMVTAAAAAVLLAQIIQIGLGYDEGKYQTRDFLIADQATQVHAAGFHTGTVIVMDPILGGYQRLYFPAALVNCLRYPSTPTARTRGANTVLVVWDATERIGVPGEVRLHLRDHYGVRLPLHPPVKLVEVPPQRIESSMKRLAYLLLPIKTSVAQL